MSIEFRKLPGLDEAQVLLCQLDIVVKQKSALEDQEDDIKNALDKLQREHGLPGFRFGMLAYASEEMPGKRTLDKMLLLENGCPAKVLNASYKVGKPSLRRTFKRLEDDEVPGA